MAHKRKARYRKFYVHTWDDSKVKALSPPQPSGQVLWAWLLTCRHASMIPGFFLMGPAALLEATLWEWSMEQFEERLGELLGQGLAKVDFSVPILWMPSAIWYNMPDNPNIVTGWARHWQEIPDCPIKNQAHLVFEEAMLTRDQESKAPEKKAFTKAFLQAFGKPTDNGIGNGSRNSSLNGIDNGIGNNSSNNSNRSSNNNSNSKGPDGPLIADYSQVEIMLSGEGFSISGSSDTQARIVRLLPITEEELAKAVKVCHEREALGIGYWSTVVETGRKQAKPKTDGDQVIKNWLAQEKARREAAQ